MSEATITVAQGIGDIFWVYQKARPLYDKLNVRILTIGNASHDVQARATSVLNRLPGIASIEMLPPVTVCPDWLNKRSTMKEASKGQSVFNYCPNPCLEAGIRLEDIDPDLPVAYDIRPPEADHGLGLKPGGYLLVYVSGDAARHGGDLEHVWRTQDWANAVDRFCYHQGVGTHVPIVLLGASYDAAVLYGIYKILKERKFNLVQAIGLSAPKLFRLLRECWFFIGYQSGLSILADNFDVNQLIVYFPRIRNMRDTWVKPRNRTNGLFNIAWFTESPSEVVRYLSVVNRPNF